MLARHTLSAVRSGCVTLAVSSVLLAACASGSPTLEERHPERAAKVHDVCRNVLGYHPIEVEYRACVDSLMQTLEGDVDQVQAMSQDRDACAAQGLKPGTAAFDVCVVDRDQPMPTNQ